MNTVRCSIFCVGGWGGGEVYFTTITMGLIFLSNLVASLSSFASKTYIGIYPSIHCVNGDNFGGICFASVNHTLCATNVDIIKGLIYACKDSVASENQIIRYNSATQAPAIWDITARTITIVI